MGPFLAMYISYSEKLKDPRWQIKRLRIFERDNFACRVCYRKDMELQVHHIDYFPGVDPWDYPNHMLTTLCKEHHEFELGREKVDKYLITTLKSNGFLVPDLLALSCKCDTDEDFVQALLNTLRDMQNG